MSPLPHPDSGNNGDRKLRSLRQSMNMDRRPPSAQSEPKSSVPDDWDDDPLPSRGPAKKRPDPDLARKLRQENEQLRSIIEEMQAQLESSPAVTGQGSWAEREQEYEMMLEEKSEQIRMLNLRLQELQKAAEEAGTGGEPVEEPSEELITMYEELERERSQLEQERQRLDEERRKLHEDEEELERKMQEMELQTAKGRADLVRQRNELQQMHSEVRRELDQAQKAGAGGENFQGLQQRHQKLSGGR